jgi:hypothetical protein
LSAISAAKSQPILVDDGAARIAGADKHRPFLGEETRRVLADRAEALDHNARTRQRQFNLPPRYIDCTDKTKTGGADFVQRDARSRVAARQRDRSRP